ncbi:hypothetical protein BGZ49_010701 [Haplosporangium sp. Z 27]|nr:hypothetical protein BGZ49_010701 [Haplosporangium sp. Z 27]
MTPALQSQRHHRRTIDRIWPPALEVKLAQWSREDDILDNEDNTKENNQKRCQHFRGYWTPDGRSTLTRSHIIPVPPPVERQGSRQQVPDLDYFSDNSEKEQENDLDTIHHHQQQQIRRTQSTGQLKNMAGSGYPKCNMMIKYKRQCKTPTPIYNADEDGSSTPGSPYTFTVVHPLKPLEPLKETQEVFKPQKISSSVTTTTRSGTRIETFINYTPSKPTSEISSLSGTTTPSSAWSPHASTVNSSPAISRQSSFVLSSSSEILLMLQKFLDEHSNGHIMYRRPTHCPEKCLGSSHTSSNCIISIDSNNGGNSNGSDNSKSNKNSNDDNDNVNDNSNSSKKRNIIREKSSSRGSIRNNLSNTKDISDSTSQSLQLDDNLDDNKFALFSDRMMFGQSPNPEEFDPNEIFMTENQMNAGIHTADSPVFFNGFPLLQMEPVYD